MSNPADDAAAFHRSGTLYGAFAFGTIVLTCYGGFLYTNRFYHGPAMVPVTFALGAVYVALGILSNDLVRCVRRAPLAIYYALQCGLLTAMIFTSPTRGFFGMIVLPVVSQSIFDLRPRYAALVAGYLMSVCVGLWWLNYGWGAAVEAVYNYSAGFAFTIAFSIITRRALHAREVSERLRTELEAANEKLRTYAAQAEELATTRERNRLAREIHDGVGHYLTVIKTQLDAAHALFATQPDRARETVAKAAKLSAEALDDVRRSVGTLRTDAARPPLPEALRTLAAHGEPVPDLVIQGPARPLPSAVEHALYRAAQEGLTNIRKHARASTSRLCLDFTQPASVQLELVDNGVGRPADAHGAGFGLTGLRERIELLGGKVQAVNRPEGGFALQVEVPA